MNLLDYFRTKNIFGEKTSSSSLRIGRNRNRKFFHNKNILKKEIIYNSPFTKNYLPLINNYNSLNATRRFVKNKNSISQRMNINYNTNQISPKFNIITFKNSLTLKKSKERPKLDVGNSKDKNSMNFTSIMNNINYNNETNKNGIKKGNKMKEIRKIINIINKSNDENINDKKMTKDENIRKNILKKEDNFNIQDKKFIKPNSMFMTEMNFLINDNKRIKNNKKMKEIKDIKSINYDSLSFKELLKHIENDKKKIINNQNDLDMMMKTAKDTYYEIWKCNRHYS